MMNTVKSILFCLFVISLSGLAAAQSETGLYVYQDYAGVHMRWSAPIERSYGGFYVERRISGSGSWQRLNEQPIARIESVAEIEAIMGTDASAFLAYFPGISTQVADSDLLAATSDEFVRSLIRLFSVKIPSMATVLAERFTDTELQGGASYDYQVILSENGAESVWASVSAITHGQPRSLPEPQELTGTPGDSLAEFSWQTDSGRSQDGSMVAFQLYRADQPYGPFELVNFEPIVPISFDGSLPESLYADYGLNNGQTYWYHLRGMDVLGNESAPGNPVEVTPGDSTPPSPPNLVRARLFAEGAFLEWEANDEEDLLGYKIYRSIDPLEGYEPIWPKAGKARNSLAHMDKSIAEGQSYWYYLVAVDQTGNESEPSAIYEILRPDVTPPEAPRGLVAEAVDDGIQLTWAANAEPDLAGYFVQRTTRVIKERSESKGAQTKEEKEKVEGIFFALHAQALGESSYLDAIDSQSQARYAYHVVAVDQAGNKSEPSATVITSMPDTVAPDSPALVSIDQIEGEVILQWQPPMDEDLAGYRLYRVNLAPDGSAIKGVQPRQIIQIDNKATLEFRDQPEETGQRYLYHVTAIDEAPNESGPSGSLQVFYLDLVGPQPPELSGQVKDGKVELSWVWPEQNEEVAYACLYRQPEGGELEFLAELNTRYMEYRDQPPEEERVYSYVIRAFDQAENIGKPSNKVELSIEMEASDK